MTEVVATDLAVPLTFDRGRSWSNRVALAPLTSMQSNPDGTLHEDEYRLLVRRAQDGFAMVMTCAAHVTRAGQAFPGQLGIFDDVHLNGLTRLADGLRAAGAVYRAPDQPVTADHLIGESIGPRFLDYLATNWDDFVA
ncbi:hypothetical protein M1C59_21555 [Gordonia terrae]|uniref:oxidoreductase n=1 Tax=Gordonia terrae TaxID=2055 RepID=UPI00200AB6B5|nr:hypothetical protein [Gordonia terrae]UPW08597.1 hypothetical protein M1C59_21555 [Gordonia terrae]